MKIDNRIIDILDLNRLTDRLGEGGSEDIYNLLLEDNNDFLLEDGGFILLE